LDEEVKDTLTRCPWVGHYRYETGKGGPIKKVKGLGDEKYSEGRTGQHVGGYERAVY